MPQILLVYDKNCTRNASNDNNKNSNEYKNGIKRENLRICDRQYFAGTRLNLDQFGLLNLEVYP